MKVFVRMKVSKLAQTLGIGLYAGLWLGGVASYLLLGGPPPEAAWTAPVFLALAAVLVLGVVSPQERRILLLGGGIGFAVEAVGVTTGFPFGAYVYTATLAPKFLGVPLVLIAAWLLLFAYVRQWTRSPLAGAAWMTAIDLVIDPLAAHSLHYWTWENVGYYYDIPWTNFAGWFVVSGLLFLLFKTPAKPNRMARGIGLSVVAFFSVIALGTGLWLAAGVGAALVMLHVICSIREARRSSPGTGPMRRHAPVR